ncbi:MAG: protein phosphatase [Paracoccaceae bacterium]
MTFAIAELAAPRGGTLGICPLPGRFGTALDDLAVLRAWQPDIVVSMTELAEMERHIVADLGGLLAQSGIGWAHFPIRDFGTPAFGAAWNDLSARLHKVLDGGGRVLAHCYGGQGRSGMVLLGLMVERGMAADAALAALRKVRPGAVETVAQQAWAKNTLK